LNFEVEGMPLPWARGGAVSFWETASPPGQGVVALSFEGHAFPMIGPSGGRPAGVL
jgi:hypothetical protein